MAEMAEMAEMASLDAVVTSVELGWRKPHPSTYWAALAALGTTAADTPFVGSTRDADYDGPRAVSMQHSSSIPSALTTSTSHTG